VRRDYYPRKLGRPRHAVASPDGRGRRELRRDHDSWREGLRRAEVDWEPVPEERVRDELFGERGQPPGFLLVTGEPGSGKSRLLEAWLEHWAKAAPALRLGARVAVLVRLRDLPREEVDTLGTLSDPASLADRLWTLKLPAPPALADRVRPFHGSTTGRLWEPVWLLDGLDELPAGLLEARFFRLLADLPGRTCVTCRTAVAQSEREKLAGCLAQAEPYELLPLSPADQEAFLAGLSGMDEARAKALHERVRRHPALRPLAGNPLMLELMAEVAEREELPGSRAEFYRLAIGTMWRRRLAPDTAERLRGPRETVLTALAARIELREVVFGLEHLDAALASVPTEEREPLRAALRTSGLLRFDARSERAEFLHLTFQEYYLARKLKEKSVGATLKERWADPRYEETLALLLALAVGEGRKAEVDAALRELIGWGLETHRRDRQTLWDLGRSPLRTVLHVVARAGVALGRFAGTTKLVEELLSQSPLLREAVGYDRNTPTCLLVLLARDSDLAVRLAVARNSAAPEEALIELRDAEDRSILLSIAGNRAMPPVLLQSLVETGDPDICAAIAENSSTPKDLLERFASDQNERVRAAVARNPAAPTVLLASLADDKNDLVRQGVAENPATPATVLAHLYTDRNPQVLASLAKRPDMICEVVCSFLFDVHGFVRLSAASNPILSRDLINCLSNDDDENLRAGVARNPSTPASVLTRLAQDPSWLVRWSVATNPACPISSLRQLANDPMPFVPMTLSMNPSLDDQLLLQLAKNADPITIMGLTANDKTSPALLAELASHTEPAIRSQVAMSARTLLEDLALYAPAEQADAAPR
jgi:hypothetical protein